MKIPQTPPSLAEILKDPDQIMRIVAHEGTGPSQGKQYRHWENLRRIQPPTGLSSEEWWATVKLARSQTRRTIPLKDTNGNAFGYCLADPVLESLYEIDRNISGRITTTDQLLNPQTRDRYVVSSLIEEAITSSQLEGASTTRDAAKQMIRSGRNPMNRSERMILNNYRAIQQVKEITAQPLTPEIVFTIQETLVEGTLEEDQTGHHLRKPDDGVAVYHDGDGTLLHTPPPAREIARRMASLCDFANKTRTDTFLHPILKAIILHFWLAYDHPFVDGNGRTARALFYWSVLSQDFWMFEFLSISAVIRRSPTRYAKSFLYTETDENDLTYFLLAQLQVIRQAIKALYTYLDKKALEIQSIEKILQSHVSINHRQLALLGHAMRHPGARYTIDTHKKTHRVTYQTARTDLLDLASRNLLVRTKTGQYFTFTAPADLAKRLKVL